MKPLVLAAGFAALGTVDLAFIDLRLVPAVLAEPPAVAAAVEVPAAPAAPEKPSPPESVESKTSMAMASPSPPRPPSSIKEKTEPAPKAEPSPTAAQPPPVDRDRDLTLHFDVNARIPAGEIGTELKSIAALLAADPALQVAIDGHSDRNGSVAYNDELSRLRATAVVEELVRLGVDRNRISSSAHGARVPVAKGKDADSMARNRRVEVHVERRKP